VGRAPTAELVIHDNGNGVGGVEVLNGEQAIVRDAGSAVNADEGTNTIWRWKCTEDCVPLDNKINDGSGGDNNALKIKPGHI